MKALKLIITLALAALFTSQAAQAILIQGSIEFAGNNTLLNNVGPTTGDINTDADYIDFGLAVVTAVTGSYSAIPSGIIGGALATFTDFSMGELGVTGPLSVDPLWTVSYGGLTYSFALTKITGNKLGAGGQRTLSGSGVVSIAGSESPYEDTFGTWKFSQSGEATFSSATSVPDSGASALLLSLGLVGLSAAVCRFKK